MLWWIIKKYEFDTVQKVPILSVGNSYPYQLHPIWSWDILIPVQIKRTYFFLITDRPNDSPSSFSSIFSAISDLGRSVMGTSATPSADNHAHSRQSKKPVGRRKVVGFDLQRLSAFPDQSTVKGVVSGRGLMQATPPTFLNNRPTPTMFSDLVDILQKKQGVMVLHSGSDHSLATPLTASVQATDRTFFSGNSNKSKFPFDRKIHLMQQLQQQQQQPHFQPVFSPSPSSQTSAIRATPSPQVEIH